MIRPCRAFVLSSMAPAAVALVVLAAAGCEDFGDDSIPQAVREHQARQTTAEPDGPSVPTTQELVSGPRTRMALGPLPLTMEVPASWKTEFSGGATLLRGYTPRGDVTIQLTSRRAIEKDDFDLLISGAKKEQAENPASILKVELRPLGDGLMYERQSVGEPGPYTVYDSNNVPHTTTEQLFKWTLSALAPSADAYHVYELNFIGLTKSQYERDREFLQRILDTLAFAPGATGSGSGTESGAEAGAGASPLPTTLP